ncbi:MAG TPA: hypothetical protein VIT91_03820 [Chthoniobacterales bacterium]
MIQPAFPFFLSTVCRIHPRVGLGDLGKGNSPNSSDGIVPYWSSHLDGAVSEDFVPTSHEARCRTRKPSKTLLVLGAPFHRGRARSSLIF